jgi:hypothetical protein
MWVWGVCYGGKLKAGHGVVAVGIAPGLHVDQMLQQTHRMTLLLLLLLLLLSLCDDLSCSCMCPASLECLTMMMNWCLKSGALMER